MNRAENLLRLREPFDLAIIGGGATGLGTAVEAAARGLKVALVEGHDFAQGTSSRSTKLVHGGVRYLAQGNLSLVREALRERGRLRRNAPHLVGDLEFVVPAYAWWTGPYYGVGLKLYDVLAGREKLGSTRTITRQEMVERLPNIQQDQLRGGIVYHDGQFDDARLALALALTASDLGAALVNYAPVQRLLKQDERVCGFVARDLESGQEHEVRAKVVVNATGVFSDAVRRMDDPDVAPCLSPSQGVHLVLPPEFFPGLSALMVPKTDDGRVLFMVPWHGKVLLGTTDTPVDAVTYEPRPQEQEIAFLLEHAKRYLARGPERSDVLSVYVGLRPLVRAKREDGKTGGLSRDHTLIASRTGLLTIVGGKWTTYRKMGEDTVDRALKVAGMAPSASTTADLRLHGAAPVEEGAAPAAPAVSGAPSGVLAAYGTDAAKVRRLCEEKPTLALPLHPRLPYLGAEVVWAVREEMARTLEDVLSRRTRALTLDARASSECAPSAARLMAQELGADAAWETAQVHAFRNLCEESLLQAGVAALPLASASQR